MASKFDFIDGKLVKFVQEDVEDIDALEAELQSNLDAAQNVVNEAVTALGEAEDSYKQAEADAETASAVLDDAQSAKEDAEVELAKSLDTKQSYAAALEVRNSQPEPDASDGDGADSEGADDGTDAPSEAVDVPVTVVTDPVEG